MNTEVLIPNNREKRTIDALARNNNIIKSLFHFDKPITFLIVTLAIQKIRANAHKGNLVIISKPEIESLSSGRDKKNGINKLVQSIREDLEIHHFFNFYNPNSGLKNIRKALIQDTALTKDLFEDLAIIFNESLFNIFKSKENYTIQYLNKLRDCKENQTMVLYALTQPYAKPQSPNLQLSISQLRLYLRVADDAYTMPRTLTMRVKKLCAEITKTTDIKLTVQPIRKNGTTGATVGYQFYSEFKESKTPRLKKIKAIDIKPISNRQQLVNWGVSKEQIDLWMANIKPKVITKAIEQTLNRPKSKNKFSNAGGYIYKILGNGKQLQLTKQIKHNEVISCIRKFGLTDNDIKKAQEQTKDKNSILTAVTNKCLREFESETVGTDDMRQFFLNELDNITDELKRDF